MKQAYGKFPRARKSGPLPSDSLIVKIHGRHNLEQFSLELQKAVAHLQHYGAFGIESCSIYLKPLDEKGERIALWSEKGEAIARIEIAAPPLPPAYRSD